MNQPFGGAFSAVDERDFPVPSRILLKPVAEAVANPGYPGLYDLGLGGKNGAIGNHQVGQLTRFERTEAVLDPEQAGWSDGQCAQCRLGR